jgi:hypothetical protein
VSAQCVCTQILRQTKLSQIHASNTNEIIAAFGSNS